MSNGSCVILQVVALSAVGLLAGAAHSWRTPIHLRVQETPAEKPAGPAPTSPAAAPATPVASAGATPATATAEPAAPLGLHITLAQAKALFDQGVTFIDARTDRDYLAGAIPGAQQITPVGFSKPQTTEKLRFLDPAVTLVVYCGGGDCHDSENLVILLQQSGYKSLHIMTDGFPAWKDAGYEVEVPAAGAGGGL